MVRLLIAILFFFIVCKPKVLESSDAVVTFLRGKASIVETGKELSPLANVTEKQSVKTDSDAVLDLTSKLGSFRLLGGSTATLAALNADSASFQVSEGNILIKASKLTKGQSLLVDTPTVVAAVRGTQFWGRVNKKDETGTFAVREGAVEITRKSDNIKVLVEAGQAVDLKPGDKDLKTRAAAKEELAAMEQIDQMK
ncbi:sigma factor regulatory protein, FecR/PupR family [Leptospira borgpetersenii serovar Mini str. 201000851]|uniref:Sigma factor regulatory protein, FecR/PupR family n=3 Tax=Leptospiraceae TaxID=170 RepID=M3H197_LEPBO|nr:sigma factor regulatory protein, FecR/PupR family [Leptospira borgpetersenii str. 200801926]EMG00864.1 sigma factor regulatory protein, FecR/PupR family [Leptospira borgpetersenii str. 200701203]EMK14462.1 sigma factor regulatory protein, FecR/PupR family [Leptospira sp. serovar Kenya str. Sh9]EMN13158.1 sigma factor regulatory protein, FecR/PupR family [Leptospira borgpetersenii str. Brem 307]ENO62373.1 sigma factor regulatory protein, FecR/PupR family [Leptospira borgpetersenii serovar Min